MHHQRPGCEAERLEEVLRLAIAGKGEGVDTHATALAAPLEDDIDERFADTDGARTRFDKDIREDAERAAVAQPLDVHHGVADHDVVDRSGEHERVVALELSLERLLGGDRARLAHRPHRSPTITRLFADSFGG